MNTGRKRKKITRELPSLWTVLKGKFKGKPYTARVVKDKTNAEGRSIKYDNKLYSSMTATAMAITKQPTNGWRFWKF